MDFRLPPMGSDATARSHAGLLQTPIGQREMCEFASPSEIRTHLHDASSFSACLEPLVLVAGSSVPLVLSTGTSRLERSRRPIGLPDIAVSDPAETSISNVVHSSRRFFSSSLSFSGGSKGTASAKLDAFT
ncbi:hypothetical protein VTK73DRAFT_4131 [Phialemonium thermophilum]|uniref:Uncharacterized protein n=1 Tax=Phialemonium thermophilum TaxID=223376 RepID=A0ABR3VBK1_9PEZI